MSEACRFLYCKIKEREYTIVHSLPITVGGIRNFDKNYKIACSYQYISEIKIMKITLHIN